jgi:DNA polymerase III alpha subunit
MIQNKFGEQIYSDRDICDLLMKGHDVNALQNITVDYDVNLDQWPDFLSKPTNWHKEKNYDCSINEFHAQQQQNWHMPDNYRNMDIAAHVLDLCDNQEQLQRCGTELMMYQERDLFDLLRYLTYLVDIMRKNNIIWGVGRGSSVASYVLYKLGVHRIDSMYYNLDIAEFLR